MATDREELLRRVPLFARLGERDLRDVASLLKERNFRAGESVTTEGAAGVGFFVIADGEASVRVHGEERSRLGRGDTFGEIALITDEARTATVTAETDLSCLGMTVWEFRPLVEQNPKLAWHFIQELGRKLHEVEQRAT